MTYTPGECYVCVKQNSFFCTKTILEIQVEPGTIMFIISSIMRFKTNTNKNIYQHFVIMNNSIHELFIENDNKIFQKIK